jgi:hypothetical protein
MDEGWCDLVIPSNHFVIYQKMTTVLRVCVFIPYQGGCQNI